MRIRVALGVVLRPRIWARVYLQSLLPVLRRGTERDEHDVWTVATVSNERVREFVREPVEGLHDHHRALQQPLQPTVLPIEAVHGAAHVHAK